MNAEYHESHKRIQDCESGFASCIGSVATFFSFLLFILTFPLSLLFCIRTVTEYQRVVIFRFGCVRHGKALGPGMFFILPCIDNGFVIDLRTVTCLVPPQDILTRDSVTVSVDAVVFHRVTDALRAVVEITNFVQSTDFLAASVLRNTLGTKNLTDLLSEREAIAEEIKQNLDRETHQWGIEVERVEIKDVSLPPQLQRAMAAEAEATREANAKIITANGEKQAAKSLRQASDVISQSKTALQLRYLQTLSDIAQEKTSTIVFPIPIDIMGGFFGSNK